MTKKLLIAMVLSLAALFSVCEASEKAVLPAYEIEINDEFNIYYWDSAYPFLNYKGVTYFPMTYEYCRAMDLVTHWDNTAGLFIAGINGTHRTEIPVYETMPNAAENEIVFPAYDIHVNGKKIDNAKQEYPLFNFRGVTYFPLTWDFAEEFFWTVEFDGAKLSLYSYRDEYFDTGRIALVEEADTYAVLRYDGKVFKKLSYETGEMTELTDYTYPDELASRSKNENITFDKTGAVYYGGKELSHSADSKAFFEAVTKDVQNFGLAIYGTNVSFAGGTALYVTADVDIQDNVFTRASREHTYILDGETPVYLGTSIMVEDMEKIGNVTYFTTRRFAQTIRRHYSEMAVTYKLENGVISPLSDKFAYTEMIGKAGEKLYIKCLTMPAGGDWGFDSRLISPYLDGIYSFDGTTLHKEATYRYASDEFVGTDGTIYAIDRHRGKLITFN